MLYSRRVCSNVVDGHHCIRRASPSLCLGSCCRCWPITFYVDAQTVSRLDNQSWNIEKSFVAHDVQLYMYVGSLVRWLRRSSFLSTNNRVDPTNCAFDSFLIISSPPFEVARVKSCGPLLVELGEKERNIKIGVSKEVDSYLPVVSRR